MWYRSESKDYPALIDDTSSKVYVYVRRNVSRFEREDGETGYAYDECKIPKDVYIIFQAQASSDSRINDIEEVLTEIIGGEA